MAMATLMAGQSMAKGVAPFRTPEHPRLLVGGRNRVVVRAAAEAGLGTTLREVGFEVTERVVVDENHTVGYGKGDVTEKLKEGFKNFKESVFK